MLINKTILALVTVLSSKPRDVLALKNKKKKGGRVGGKGNSKCKRDIRDTSTPKVLMSVEQK